MVSKLDGDRVDQSWDRTQASTLSSEALLAQPGANQYLKTTARQELPTSLPNADDLLRGLNDKNPQPLYDRAQKPGKHDETPKPKSWDDVVRDTNEKQHKIAEQARKDPHVRKVTETKNKEDGGIETVSIWKKDGTIIVHGADGTKTTKVPNGPTIIEKNGKKTVIQPHDDEPQLKPFPKK